MTTYITMKGTDRLTLQQAEALLEVYEVAIKTLDESHMQTILKGDRAIAKLKRGLARANHGAEAARRREDEPTAIRVGNVTGRRLRGRDEAFAALRENMRKANLDCWGWLLRHKSGMLKRIPPVCGMDVPRESAEKVAKVWGEELDEGVGRG